MKHAADHTISGARRFGRHLLHQHQHGKFADHAPGLHKWWKAHLRLNGQITEHISPFQQKVVSTLLKDLPSKLKHKVVDNWHFWPALLSIGYFQHWCDHTYHELEKEEWP